MRKYLDQPGKKPHWLARFPMVKAAIKGIDALQVFVKNQNQIEIDKFALLGGSKRGWTVWLVAALDKRVSLVVPTVIDILQNFKVVENIYKSMCFWPPALIDYEREGILARIREPGIEEIRKLEDPFEFRHRLKLPKYIVNSAGDQFFPPDSSRFSYQYLEGVKYLRYVPVRSGDFQ